MRSLFAAVCCCVVTSSAIVRADLVVTVAAPSGGMAADVRIPLRVYWLNTGGDAITAAVPEQIPCRLLESGRAIEVPIRRGDGVVGEQRIDAGSFREVVYFLDLPAGIDAGTHVLELQRPGSPRTALVVADPVAAPDVGIRSEVATDDPSAPPRPSATSAPRAGDSGIAEYVPLRFSGHEPMYFIAGPDSPNAKFQISFKYQIVNPDGPLAAEAPALAGLHLAYNQTSFWDLESESAPFLDSSYRPELLWSAPDVRFGDGSLLSRLGFQAGVQHESNGRAGEDSRSLNIVYVRPSVTFGDRESLFLTLAPRIWTYIGSLEDNADIEDYRGYGDLRAIVGKGNGLQLSTTARLGDDWDKGSLQFDLSYPLRRLSRNNFDIYLHAQYFNGYGESLLFYDESTSAFRLGISLIR